MHQNTLRIILKISTLLFLPTLVLIFFTAANWIKPLTIKDVPVEAYLLIGGLIVAAFVESWNLYFHCKSKLLHEKELGPITIKELKRNMRFGLWIAILAHLTIAVAAFRIFYFFSNGINLVTIVGTSSALLAIFLRPVAELVACKLKTPLS